VKLFYYLERESGLAIQVRAKRRPSTKNGDQHMIVFEWDAKQNNWQMPAFPEVGWGVLSKMVYLGRGDSDLRSKTTSPKPGGGE
jgi:hypothetical protein